MIVRDLLHQSADALGLLKRILHHLLQIEPVAGRLRKLVAVLLDLIHVEQQRRQGSVQLPGNRSARLFGGTRARGGQLDDLRILFERCDAFHPLREVRISGALILS